jgi:hypothetical protein
VTHGGTLSALIPKEDLDQVQSVAQLITMLEDRLKG